MPGELKVVSGKFTFRIPTDRQYTAEGVWVRYEADGRARLGLSDFVQQRSGDAAFIEIQPAGTRLQAGDAFATLETIKITTTFVSPLGGEVMEVNAAVETAPELINSDPYGQGWLAVIAPSAPAPAGQLLAPESYFAQVQNQAKEAS